MEYFIQFLFEFLFELPELIGDIRKIRATRKGKENEKNGQTNGSGWTSEK